MRTTRRPRSIALVALCATLLVGLGAAACSDDEPEANESDTQVVIADHGFAESEIAAQIYGQVLSENGYQVVYQSLKDRAAVYAAFESGDIDFEPDYAASALEFLNGNAGEASADLDGTVEALQERLADKGLVALEASKALDTNSLVVTAETAEEYGLSKISDLTEELSLGGPQDCPTNAGCIPALQAKYGKDMSANFVPLDSGGPNTAAALENGDIDVAVLFSTDATIASNGWVVLEDDQGIFNADYIIPVVTEELGGDQKLVDLLNEVSAALTTDKITDLNRRFIVDKEDADDIAEDFLESEGLL